jgi:hypothetical protein
MLYIAYNVLNNALCYTGDKDSVVTCATEARSHAVRKTESEGSKARTRSLHWMKSLWEGTGTTAREEDRKEEVLAVFRELARESRHEREVREYVPWAPLW